MKSKSKRKIVEAEASSVAGPETAEDGSSSNVETIEMDVLQESILIADEPAGGEAVAEVVSAAETAGLSDLRELEAVIEALLFTSPEPLPIKKIVDALETVDSKTIRDTVATLVERYDREGRGIQIIELAAGFQMGTRDRFAEYVLRLGSKKKRQTLSPATLETLSIIAYLQPVIRATVESIRGVESSGTIRNLLDMGLIEITGYKEVIGRPPMYGTTPKFLNVFGLRSLRDLPSIRGLKEKLAQESTTQQDLFAEKAEESPAETPVEQDQTPPEQETASGIDESAEQNWTQLPVPEDVALSVDEEATD